MTRRGQEGPRRQTFLRERKEGRKEGRISAASRSADCSERETEKPLSVLAHAAGWADDTNFPTLPPRHGLDWPRLTTVRLGFPMHGARVCFSVKCGQRDLVYSTHSNNSPPDTDTAPRRPSSGGVKRH